MAVRRGQIRIVQAKSELQSPLPRRRAVPTPKPERLMQRIVHIASNPGDVVLDCFAGSGTTAAVAQKMGRRWIAVESVARHRLHVRAAAAREGRRGRRSGRDHEGRRLGGRRRVPRARGRAVDVRRGRRARVARRVGGGRLARRGDRGAARLRATSRSRRSRDARDARGSRSSTGSSTRTSRGCSSVRSRPRRSSSSAARRSTLTSTQALRELRPGSRARKIPASILAEYRIGLEWR